MMTTPSQLAHLARQDRIGGNAPGAVHGEVGRELVLGGTPPALVT